MVETTHYELLGVSPDASPDEIKSAYRRAARRYHPDTNPDNPSAADHFKVIVAAYETLGNADRRADYDDALLHPDSSYLDGEHVDDGYVDADDVGNGFGDDGEGFATDGFATGDPQASGWYTDDDGFPGGDHAAGFTGHHGFGDDDPAATGFAGNGRGGHGGHGGPMPDDGYATGWGDDLGNPTSAANRAHAAGRGDDTWAGRHDDPAPSDPRTSPWFDPNSHGWGEDGDAEGEWFAGAHPAAYDDGWVEPPPPGSHLIGPDGTTYIVDAHGVVYPIDGLDSPGAAPFAPSGHGPLGWSPAPLGLGARVLQVLLVLVVMWVVDGIVGASVSNFAESAGDWWTTDHDARDVANDPDATPPDRVEAEAASEAAGADLRSETIRLLTIPVAGALAWPASYLLLRPRRHLHYS